MKNPSPLMLREQRMFEQAQREEQERQEQEQRLRQERHDRSHSELPSKPPSYAESVNRRPRNLLHRGSPYHSRPMAYDRSRDPRFRCQSTGKKSPTQQSDPVDELVRMMGGMGSAAGSRSSGRTGQSGDGCAGVSVGGTLSKSGRARTTRGSDSMHRNPIGDVSKSSTRPNSVPTSTYESLSNGLNWVSSSAPTSFGAAATSVSSAYGVPPAPSSNQSVDSSVPDRDPLPAPDASSNIEDNLARLLREASSSSGVVSYPDIITYPSTALGGVPTPPASPTKDTKGKSKTREQYSPVVPLSTLLSAVPDTTSNAAPEIPYPVQPTPAPPTSHKLQPYSHQPPATSHPQILLPTAPAVPTIAPISSPPQPPTPSLPVSSPQPTSFTGPTRTIKTIHLLHTASPYARHRPNYAPDACSLNLHTPWNAFMRGQDMQDPITLDWNACQNAADPETNALALTHLDRAVERHYWTQRWLKSCEMDGLDLDGNGVDDFAENGTLPPLTMLIPEEVKPIIFQRLCDLDDALTPPDFLYARLDATSNPRPAVARAYMISDEARDRYRYIYKGFRLLAAQLLGCGKMDQLFPTILDWDADLVI